MSWEIIELDTADGEDYLCSPELEVSGTGITSEPRISEITLVSNGYTRKDSIVKFKLTSSILGSDNMYSTPVNELYTFKKSDGSTKEFDIVAIEEISGVSIISVYGKTTELTKFFGTLAIGSLSGYLVLLGTDLKIAQKDKCKKPTSVKFYNVSSTGISVTLKNTDFNFIYKWILRYRKSGDLEWTIIETTNQIIDITGLTSTTLYEVDVLTYCTESNFSDYSDIFVFTTI